MQVSLREFKYLNFIYILILSLVIPIAYLILGQDFNWDLQNYHLYIPITYYEGSFDYDTAPAGIQSYFNIITCLPAYLIHRLSNTPF